MNCRKEKNRTSLFSLLQTMAVCTVFLLGTACQPGEQIKKLEEEGSGILERYRAQLCEQEKLEREAAALWDEVSKNLDARLPKDMPADERRNMIQIRNTNLIKMFEVYPSLDTTVKTIVEKAGDADDAIVVKLRKIRQDLEEEDFRFMKFLEILEPLNAGKAKEWKTKLGSIKKSPCAVN